MSRPWKLKEDTFRCCCGLPAVVVETEGGSGFSALCFAHEKEFAVMWPLPPEAPDEFVSGEDQPPPQSIVDWIQEHQDDEDED